MSSQLVPIGPNSLIPAERELETMLRIADLFVKSGLMPNGVKTAAAAFTIMQTGREIGAGPMASIRGIRVIQGKAEVSPNLAAALIHRDHDDDFGPALVPVESSEERATFKYKRRGERAYQELTYTVADATRAKLIVPNATDSTWAKFRQDMLVARCLGRIAKLHFQDTINGLYLFGEVEHEITGRLVDFETGEAIDAPPPMVAVEGGHVDETTGEFRPVPDEPRPSNDPPATPSQVKFVQSLAREIGLSEDQLSDEAVRISGATIGELGRRDASALIEWLQARKMSFDVNPEPPASPDAPPAPPQPSTAASVTQRDIARLHAAGHERKLDHDHIHALALKWYGAESVKALTLPQLNGAVDAFTGANRMDDETLATDLIEASGMVDAKRAAVPIPNSPEDMAAIQAIAATPSTASDPEAERRQQIADERDTWTPMWRVARANGLKTREDLERYLGHPIRDMLPAQVMAELQSRLAEQGT